MSLVCNTVSYSARRRFFCPPRSCWFHEYCICGVCMLCGGDCHSNVTHVKAQAPTPNCTTQPCAWLLKLCLGIQIGSLVQLCCVPTWKGLVICFNDPGQNFSFGHQNTILKNRLPCPSIATFELNFKTCLLPYTRCIASCVWVTTSLYLETSWLLASRVLWFAWLSAVKLFSNNLTMLWNRF